MGKNVQRQKGTQLALASQALYLIWTKNKSWLEVDRLHSTCSHAVYRRCKHHRHAYETRGTHRGQLLKAGPHGPKWGWSRSHSPQWLMRYHCTRGGIHQICVCNTQEKPVEWTRRLNQVFKKLHHDVGSVEQTLAWRRQRANQPQPN